MAILFVHYEAEVDENGDFFTGGAEILKARRGDVAAVKASTHVPSAAEMETFAIVDAADPVSLYDDMVGAEIQEPSGDLVQFRRFFLDLDAHFANNKSKLYSLGIIRGNVRPLQTKRQEVLSKEDDVTDPQASGTLTEKQGALVIAQNELDDLKTNMNQHRFTEVITMNPTQYAAAKTDRGTLIV